KIATQVNRYPTGLCSSFGANDANVVPGGNPNGMTWTSVAGARTGGAGSYYWNVAGSGFASWYNWSLAMGTMRNARVRFWTRLNSGTSNNGLTISLRDQTDTLRADIPARQAITNAWVQHTFNITFSGLQQISIGEMFFDFQWAGPADVDIDDIEV